MEIRKHCEAHGLPVPPEAELQKDSCPKKFRKTPAKAPATAPRASASPAASEAYRAEAPRAQSAAQPPAQRAGSDSALDHPECRPIILFEAGEGPVEQLRQLRGLALGLLPDLEDLPLEVAAQAHDEMALLKKVLVLGEDLIVRRTA